MLFALIFIQVHIRLKNGCVLPHIGLEITMPTDRQTVRTYAVHILFSIADYNKNHITNHEKTYRCIFFAFILFDINLQNDDVTKNVQYPGF